MNSTRRLRLASVLLLPLGLLACRLNTVGNEPWDPPSAPATASAIAPREKCAEQAPLRQALFGDLHVHTSYSMDARAQDTQNGPREAYQFARGEPILIGPFDEKGKGSREVQIDRPLDFAAVTDHAEWLGEVGLCTTPTSSVYDSTDCRVFRGEEESWLPALLGFGGKFGRFIALVGLDGRNDSLCGSDGTLCRDELKTRWALTKDAAEEYYDRTSACAFTTMVAWEFSHSPERTKIHRNVILRNELSPELPISSIEEPTAHGLWAKLQSLCNETGTGCEALSIPHNPNLSNGQMFTVDYKDLPLEEQRERAALRAKTEPIVEMTQLKGDSECANGLWAVEGGADEFCEFEKSRVLRQGAPPEDCKLGTGWGAQAGKGCQSRLDFARYALIEGMREADRIGVNPYPFGFIGSTDSHNGTPGAVDERNQFGSNSATDPTPQLRLATPKRAGRSAGGLAGVWAEENSRNSIFDALQRRETFATSGPRIQPRFFGSWKFNPALCDDPLLLEQGYAQGVPMGGELPPTPTGAVAPTFVVTGLRDPGTAESPGGLLQRIQIIKGWPGKGDEMNQKVFDVAGGANGASVDLDSCTPKGPGHESLCAVWTDPDFDPTQRAVYYARVLENPSCRWSTHQCLALPAAERPATCGDGPEAMPKTLQERAWTSPIWFTPESKRAKET